MLDSAGNVLVRFEALRDYSHVVVYSDRFADGETYTLTMGADSQSVQMTTDSTGGMASAEAAEALAGTGETVEEPPKHRPKA